MMKLMSKIAIIFLLTSRMNFQVGQGKAEISGDERAPKSSPGRPSPPNNPHHHFGHKKCQRKEFTFNNLECEFPKILTGTVSKVYYQTGNSLENGSPPGDRSDTIAVVFPRPFGKIPVVFVALSGFDFDKDQNQRLKIKAENISDVGFDLVVSTWWDTKVYFVSVDYSAFA